MGTKTMKRQRAAVEEEITAAGLTLGNVEEVLTESAGGLTGKLKSAMVATVGGRLAFDSLHVYEIEGAAGPHRFIQPYSGNVTLPGEHRAVVQGNVPVAFKVVQPWLGNPDNLRLILGLGLLTCGLFWVAMIALAWRAPKVVCDDPALQAKLRADPKMKQALSGLKFQWGAGLSVIELDWAVQVRPLGDGTSEVIMATGRYGGFTTYKVGMKQFDKLVAALPNVLPQDETHAAQAFLEPIRFETA